MKKYRVWFHYYRQFNCMSVHWKGQCYKVQDIDCQVPVETQWKKRQPQLILKGWATDVTFDKDKAVIV